MKSIDRLREYVEKAPRTSISLMARSILLGMVRTIEQEAEDELKAKDGQMWLRGYGECHAQLVEGNEVIVEDLEKAGWVKLPLDADGIPIRIGDVMEWPDTSTAEVVGIGDGTFFYVEDGEDAADWSSASDKIHHHAPTVEDVLREFADRVCNSGHQWGLDAADTIAEYAAKLRLADHAEA